MWRERTLEGAVEAFLGTHVSRNTDGKGHGPRWEDPLADFGARAWKATVPCVTASGRIRWDLVRAILGGAIGVSLPLLVNYLAARRERGRRLHDLYAEFIAAAYVVHRRFRDAAGAAEGQAPSPTADGMDDFQRARVRLLMVERDRARQRLIEEIAGEAQQMLGSSIVPDRMRHADTLRRTCDELVDALKGSLV